MRKSNIKNLSVEELVDRFAEIGRAQDRALLGSRLSEFGRLYNRMREVDEELRARGREARLALRRLYQDPNMQVRLQAARWSLGVAPEAGAVIEAISKSAWYPQAGDAGMCLSLLDDGTFKPD